MTAAEVFLQIAFVAMFLHLVLGAIARRGLGDLPALEAKLFAIPNRALGTPGYIRLLRVRYFLPFRPLPEAASELAAWARTTLSAARFSGLCFLCAFIGFFGALFAQASG
jgi:hypothetical protein